MTTISIEDILFNHGAGPGGGVTILQEETEPTGTIKPGTIWHRLSDGQVKMYLANAFQAIGGGGTSLSTLVGQYTTTTITSTMAVPIANFDPNEDILFVTQNTTQLTQGIDYVLNKNTKTIQKLTGDWQKGTFFTFLVIATTQSPARDSIMLAQYEQDVQVAAGLSNVSFSLTMFNPLTDILRVHRNNLELFNTIDWALNSNERSVDLIQPTATGDKYHFTVLKKVRGLVPEGGADGASITDKTITQAKLSFAPALKVNTLPPDDTGNVTVAARHVPITDTSNYFTTDNVDAALKELGRSTRPFKVVNSSKDTFGIFRRVELRDKDTNALYSASVLSGGTAPNYTTRTLTHYEADGVTVKKTDSFTLSYDGDGDLLSEV